jgi:hypothetical protein
LQRFCRIKGFKHISSECVFKKWKKEKSNQRRKGFKAPFNRNDPNRNNQNQYAKGESKKEYSLGKKGKTTNPVLGIQRRSHVQGFPTQNGQSEDCAQRLRGYTSRRYGKNLCSFR